MKTNSFQMCLTLILDLIFAEKNINPFFKTKMLCSDNSDFDIRVTFQ